MLDSVSIGNNEETSPNSNLFSYNLRDDLHEIINRLVESQNFNFGRNKLPEIDIFLRREQRDWKDADILVNPGGRLLNMYKRFVNDEYRNGRLLQNQISLGKLIRHFREEEILLNDYQIKR